MRPRPNSRPVLTDDEVRVAMTKDGATDNAVRDVLADRAKAHKAAQAAYDAKTMRSRNDRHVMKQAQELQARLAAEAEEASRERAKGDGKTAEEERDAAMMALAQREHNGRRWGDMPVLHLLNAAQKHGIPEMKAYAEWKRTHR